MYRDLHGGTQQQKELIEMLKNLKRGGRGFTLVEIMIVVLIIGILLSIAIPNFVKAREQSRAKACSANLTEIDASAQMYAMDQKLPSGSTLVPTLNGGLYPAYLHTVPACPSSGTYAAGATIDIDWTCSSSTAAYPHSETGT
jgi:prepilin-type N-terminal cleavage/methylation domain-containing protein